MAQSAMARRQAAPWPSLSLSMLRSRESGPRPRLPDATEVRFRLPDRAAILPRRAIPDRPLPAKPYGPLAGSPAVRGTVPRSGASDLDSYRYPNDLRHYIAALN